MAVTERVAEDDRTPVYGTTIDPSTSESLCVDLVDAVTTATDLGTGASDWTLYDEVDPVAVHALYRHAERRGGTDWTFTFSVGEYDLHLAGDGDLVVYHRLE